MDNVVPLKMELGHTNTPEGWRDYIGEATEMERAADQSKVQAIIEKGRRIKEFHLAYNADKKRFGKTWVEVCKEIAGVDQSTCSKYEAITAIFILSTNNDSLPPNLDCLYDLARAIQSDRKTFDDAVEAGEVNPSMDRAAAKTVANRAKAKGEGGADARILELTKAGHGTTEIAHKLGLTTKAGGKLSNQQARSRINRVQDRIGIIAKAKTKPQTAASPKARLNPMDRPHIKGFFSGQLTTEERVGLDPVQRTHLHAFSVKQMLDAQAATHELLLTVVKAAASGTPDAVRFFELIDQMLTWVPDKQREGTGWDTDFAVKAKKTLASLDKHLDKAVERLTALQALIKARKMAP